jgi:hypothetical protein
LKSIKIYIDRTISYNKRLQNKKAPITGGFID